MIGQITELRLPKYGPKLWLWRHVKFGIFKPPSCQKLISNYFFLILLPIIVCYKTNKRAKLYHDQVKICGIMAVQIWPKISIFPKFWTYALRYFYADYSTDFKYKHFYVACDTFLLHNFKDIWNFLEVEVFWFDLQFDYRSCCFWAILLIFKCDYLDNKKR